MTEILKTALVIIGIISFVALATFLLVMIVTYFEKRAERKKEKEWWERKPECSVVTERELKQKRKEPWEC